jgi:hypothetical protein
MSKENAVEEQSVDEDLNILVEELSEGPDACCKGGFSGIFSIGSGTSFQRTAKPPRGSWMFS